jgi:hypothetical protein
VIAMRALSQSQTDLTRQIEDGYVVRNSNGDCVDHLGRAVHAGSFRRLVELRVLVGDPDSLFPGVVGPQIYRLNPLMSTGK